MIGLLHLVAVAAIVSFMGRLLPPHGDEDLAVRVELATAIVETTSSTWERYQLAKIARYESNLRRDVADCHVTGPQGELGAWQILPRSRAERGALCLSYAGDAAIALERIRESVTACGRRPEPERLALYARGRCDSVEGQRLSRTRWVSRHRAPSPEVAERHAASPDVTPALRRETK